MTNSKTTRKALLSSVLALTLCVAMLIATTFAWFTDTASTSVNKIQAGTLDVALEMATEWNPDGSVKTWESAEGKTLAFKKAAGGEGQTVLWEPGCTYSLPELRVVNNGSLALKYKIIISGIQGSAKLNEAIEWTINDADINLQETKLAANTKGDAFTIKGHMKEDAGNEYQDKTIDGISITVYATQATGEYDSNNDTYDQNAMYPLMPKVDITTVKTAAVDGSSALTANVEMTASTIPMGTILYTDHAGSAGNDNRVTASSNGTLEETVKTTAASASEMTIAINYNYIVNGTTTEVKGFSQKIEHTFPLSKGLTSVTVKHEGTFMSQAASLNNYKSDDFEGSYYDSTTGTLYIKSSNYSDFQVVIEHGFVAAVNGQGYKHFADAVEAAGANGTVALVDDLKQDIIVDGTLTLDLGGNKITNKSGDTITVKNGATLTINGSGTVDNVTHEKAAIYNNGTVTLNGGTYTRSGEKSSSKTDNGGNSFYNILNHGTMEINNGVTVTSTGAYSSLIASGYWYYSSGDARTGYVSGTNAKHPMLTITGGSFSGGINTIKNDDGATLSITGGKFSNTTQACVQNHHIATISGGTFNPTGADAVINCGVCSSNVDKKDEHKVTISGGTFNGNVVNTVGTVTFENESYKLNGKYVVYTADALREAVKSDSHISTVTLGADIKCLAARIDVERDITIDLNRKEMSSTAACKNGSVFNVASGKVTIQNGTLIGIEGETGQAAPYNKECDVVTVRSGATATLKNVTITVNSKQGACVYAFDGAKVYIQSGTYINNATGTGANGECRMLVNQADGTKQAIFISGGTFHGANPADGDNSDTPTTFLADGYKSIESDNVWTVSKA